MIRGSKTIALALAILSITSSTSVFANEKVEYNTDFKTESIEVSEEFESEEGAEQEFNQLEESRISTRGVKETKLSGSDRYKTAINVSKAGWSTSNKAILVQGYALADALTVAPLAEEYNAPILLTEKDKLNGDTLNELKRLGVKEITLIGSEGVISKAQADFLVSQGFSIERLGGANRVDTSVKVAYKLKEIYAKKNSGMKKTVFIANGVKGLADATSVASPAGFKDAVILYTNGSNLNGIKNYINTSADDVYLVGGTSAISSGVENELKNTTNKKITRIAGTDRKDTNAKVINEFFPTQNINKLYVAKDGSGNEGQLVDALAVGSLAGREKNPVLLASDNLGTSQKTLVDKKDIKEAVQVGDGRNANAFKQAVGIINAIAQPEPSDGMRLPKIQFAKEGHIKINSKFGGPIGGAASSECFITGPLYVKYGDPKLGAHAYGVNNQEQYNQVVSHVKSALQSINFRHEPEWVYMMHYVNGGKANSFIDPILKQKGRTTTYGQWKSSNSQVLSYISSGKLSKSDAETLAMYRSAVAHVERLTKPAVMLDDSDSWMSCSAYTRMTSGKTSSLANAFFRLVVADMIGMNAMIGGTSVFDANISVVVGNYWWKNGRVVEVMNGTNIPLKKTDNLFLELNGIYAAPTYNLQHIYKK